MIKDQLDSTDLRILDELTKDARESYTEIARRIHASNSLVHQRVRKLKELGLLQKATYRIDPIAMGYETCAFTQIMVDHIRNVDSVIHRLNDIPEIVECVNISGRYAILVKIYALNNSHLRDLIYEQIQSIDAVEGTNTTVVFETSFIRNIAIPKI